MLLNLYVLCGVPGSGKTTYAKQLSEDKTIVKLSYDELRCPSQLEFARLIRKELRNGKSVVADTVNNSVFNRKLILDFIKDIECNKVLVFLDTALDDCLTRNNLREKPMNPNIIKCIHKSFQTPTLDEGWDEIIII